MLLLNCLIDTFYALSLLNSQRVYRTDEDPPNPLIDSVSLVAPWVVKLSDLLTFMISLSLQLKVYPVTCAQEG